MPDFPTFADLFRVGRDEVLARNGRLSRDAVERDGMDANILTAVAAAVGDQVIGQLRTVAAGTFLDSAKGPALDRLVFDRYGLVRKSASASVGTAAFTTPSPAAVTFNIPLGTKLQTVDGIQFVTTDNAAFLVGTSGPLAVPVRSVLAGADQNVKADTLKSIIGAVPSSPSGFAVTNPFATAGGDDAESDESLRDRARRFFTTARRGTLAALEVAALGVPGVQKATAIEVVDALGRPARLVQLVVADSFTEQFIDYSVVPPLYQVQSQLLSAIVFNALNDVRAAGIFVQVYVANVILLPIQLALTFSAGTDVNTAALAARAAIVGYLNGLSPGASFVLKDAYAVLQRVPGLASSGNNIISPAGNVAALPLQVLRTSLGLVAAVAAQTNQPIITGQNPDAFTLARS